MKSNDRAETPIIGAKAWIRIVWGSIAVFSAYVSLSAWKLIVNCLPYLMATDIWLSVWFPVLLIIAIRKFLNTFKLIPNRTHLFFTSRKVLVIVNLLSTVLIAVWTYFYIIIPSSTVESNLIRLSITNDTKPKQIKRHLKYGNSTWLSFYPKEFPEHQFTLSNSAYKHIPKNWLPDLLVSDSLNLYISNSDSLKLMNNASSSGLMKNCSCNFHIDVYGISDQQHDYLPVSDEALQKIHNMAFVRVAVIFLVLVLLPFCISMLIVAPKTKVSEA